MASPCLGGLWFGYCLRIEPLNKRRLGEAVLRAGGFANAEAAARAVNAEPWDPMPGMVKRECPECRYWFARAGGDQGRTHHGPRRQQSASAAAHRRPGPRWPRRIAWFRRLHGDAAQRPHRSQSAPAKWYRSTTRRCRSSRPARNCATGSIASRADLRQHASRSRGGFGIRFTVRSWSLVPAHARSVTPRAMNSRLGWTDEATSRAVNAQPWSRCRGWRSASARAVAASSPQIPRTQSGAARTAPASAGGPS
jgi:hypothetical protein